MQKENCLLRATMQEKILIMFINLYSAKKSLLTVSMQEKILINFLHCNYS